MFVQETKPTKFDNDWMIKNNIIINQKTYQWNIVWPSVIVFGLLHVGFFYGLYLRYTGLQFFSSVLWVKFISICCMLGVNAGAHRFYSHRSYEANSAFQILLMILQTMTFQNSMFVWARDHRLHHKYVDTDADPYNSKRGFFFSHVGWLLVRKLPDVMEKGKEIDLEDLKSNKIVMFQHRYYHKLMFIWGIIMPIFVMHYFCGEDFVTSFFVVGVYRYVLTLNLTWGINSFAHLYGIKPYDKNIMPVENQLIMIAGGGEGFHNYHHTFPWDYRAAEFSTDFRNISSVFIDLFAKIGWVTNRRIASEKLIHKRIQRTGDGSYDTKPSQSFSGKFMKWMETSGLSILFFVLI